MLMLSAILLAATALLGLGLLRLYQRMHPVGWFWLPGAAHGVAGLAGFALLLLSLGGPPRGERMGAGSFGMIAAVLFAGALAAAPLVFAARLRRSKLSPLAIGLHATLAIAGFTILATYLDAS
jgi:hypothetical protein